MKPEHDQQTIADDVRQLHELGYGQELARRMNGFSNLTVSLSIICILAGGITSFHLGFCSVGGAAIGLGWPIACLFSLVVAAAMAQIASAFPTAGGLYHWAAILGGRGWGWTTAWFNLAGLITVLAAINVGTYQFVAGSFFPHLATHIPTQLLFVAGITASQALVNHLGIRATTLLTDFSGYWILFVAAALTIGLLVGADSWEPARLITFSNFSGLPADAPVWPQVSSLTWLFALGLLLPAYTITGFDASAHVSEETIGAAINVPRGIVRSVLVSGIAGWIMLAAIVLAIPDMDAAARQGPYIIFWTLREVLPAWAVGLLCAGIAIAQYLCGLATVTSASRMAFAFARDGGLPASAWLRRVCPRFRTPDIAIWCVAATAFLFTVYTPVYSTITAVCTIFLYISYVLPSALGIFAYGTTWTRMGPWQLGRWFRPLAAVSVAGCVAIIGISLQPPNEKAAWVVGGTVIVLASSWMLVARRRFAGPPVGITSLQNQRQLQPATREMQRDDNWLAQAASHTPARIFVDRSGPAYRTSTQLELRRDHAFARDAVNNEVDLVRDFEANFVNSRNLFCVQSQAGNKREFLLRPDLGRRLSDAARDEITRRCPQHPSVQIVLGDGLSAAAVVQQVPLLLPLLEAEINRWGWQLGQTFLVRHCRVGIINDIGDLLAPDTIVLLIGERPGLATAESLSVYLAFRPRGGQTDANRNLISNIHPRGVSAAEAAVRIANLIAQMHEQQVSGTAIKERLISMPPPAITGAMTCSSVTAPDI